MGSVKREIIKELDEEDLSFYINIQFLECERKVVCCVVENE
ncbi:hypothetical protein T4B_7382 [Trichinella pseudospiralis]|uniref:Uncharacterized protein n=1 Tax=Trichinella pseudospiralis TaxID=6337 RepID=A0A0V1GGE0_TRIPS|nr:hypothetical protein T4B_7382 [Trichinella pseudospiralis]